MSKIKLAAFPGMGNKDLKTPTSGSGEIYSGRKIPLPEDNIDNILKNVNFNGVKFTNKQIQELTSLSTSYGPLLTLNNRDLLYEVVCGCFMFGVDSYISFLDSSLELFKTPNDVIFNDKAFEKQKKQYINDTDKMRRDVTIRTGQKCKYCKSTNTSSIMAQLRSGDEGSNTITQCFNCGKKFKE